MGFGAGGFGALAFGAGCPPAIQSAEQITRNTIRVTFTGPVSIGNRGAVFDALYDRAWFLSPFSDASATVPRVLWAEVDSIVPNSVILYLDARLSAFVAYDVTVMDPVIPGGSSYRFTTFGQLREATARVARSFDLANRPSGDFGPGDPQPLGTLLRDVDGDFKNDEGLENLRKRIVRRLTTRRGAFAHLPEYGLNLPLKATFRPSALRDIQSQAEAQIRSEPGVLDVSIVVSIPAPGILRIGARVSANTGDIGVNVSVPVPVV